LASKPTIFSKISNRKKHKTTTPFKVIQGHSVLVPVKNYYATFLVKILKTNPISYRLQRTTDYVGKIFVKNAKLDAKKITSMF